MVGTNRALESYRELDNTFASTREHQLLVDLAEAVEQGDQEKFSEKLFLYDQLSKLDKVSKLSILYRLCSRVLWPGGLGGADGSNSGRRRSY